MEKWLTYDQISLIPTRVSTLRSRIEANTNITFGPYGLLVPIIAAPMKDVCGDEMCIALWRRGALGIAHRFQDVENQIHQSPHGSCLAAAVGISEDYMARVKVLHEHEVPMICIDTANGASVRVQEALGKIKDKYPDIFIIAGNVASGKTFRKLEEWGADAIRVGIAGGSVCETRTETGIYSPMATVLDNIALEYAWHDQGYIGHEWIEEQRPRTALLIADGGIRTPADMCKALALGADVVMMGGALAGTKESPGEILKIDGKLYKKLRGAASFSTQKENTGEEPDYVEGAETLIPYRGSVEKVINRFAAGLRSSMSYMNSRDLTEYRKNVKIVEI